ncbi:MAG: EAL domain-containing protein [Campylobacterales bacterium]|nr:EAL domain-containing protein [Campylobacterales bacterium]
MFCESWGIILSRAVFLETIVKMGQQMKIIAEGIEQKEQLEYLLSIGCDLC